MIEAPKHSIPRQGLSSAAMIDMVFLMVFYFLAVGAIERDSKALELDLASSSASAASGAVLLVNITADGLVLLNGQPIDLAALATIDTDGLAIIVRAADEASHAAVTQVLEAISRAGVTPRLEL